MLRTSIPRKHRKDAGFTLTEIMVVVFIIGLLSTVVVINVMGARSGAQIKTTRANLTALNGALQQYGLDMYDYPTTQEGLEALVERPAGAASNTRYRDGGYINKVPNDGWNRPFVYRKPGENSGRPYDLLSLGADGEPGGEEENADISVWDR